MPYASVARPSIALGTLAVGLEREGISSSVMHPHLRFAEEIGLDVYTALVTMPGHTLVGEWTFSAAAFPAFVADERAFLELNAPELAQLAPRLGLVGDRATQAVTDLLRGVRQGAAAFVEAIAREIVAASPRIVGCTSTFQQHCASLALLRRIRALAPQIGTVLGGGNCDGPMGRATRASFPWVDFVVSGEADATFPELCRRLLRDRRAAGPWPAGVHARSRERKPAVAAPETNGDSPVVADLDTLPVPDYRSYFEALRASALAPYVQPGVLIETARGCWWGEKVACTFCGLNGRGMTFRSKSPARVVSELETLSARHATKRFEAVDNIIDPAYFETVLADDAVTRGGYSIFYETKADMGRRELRRLAAAGVRWIQPGIESMHDRMLKLMRKGTTVGGNVRLLRWAQECGIRVEWLFLFGAPGEDDAWYAEMASWLPAISHLQAPSGLSRIEYDRFSAYEAEPRRYGITVEPDRRYAHVYPVAPEVIRDLAYYFEDYRDTRRGVPDAARGPGLAAWFGLAVRWRVSWMKADLGAAPAPVLARRWTSGGAHVVDTRPGFGPRELELGALSSAVLRACDEGCRRDALAGAHGLGAWSGVEIAAACDELEDAALLLDVNGRLIDLTVAEGSPPLPRDFPGGDVDVDRYVRDSRLARFSSGGGFITAWTEAR